MSTATTAAPATTVPSAPATADAVSKTAPATTEPQAAAPAPSSAPAKADQAPPKSAPEAQKTESKEKAVEGQPKLNSVLSIGKEEPKPVDPKAAEGQPPAMDLKLPRSPCSPRSGLTRW